LEYRGDTGEILTLQPPAPPTGGRFGEVADIAIAHAVRPWPLMTICGGASCAVGNVRYQVAEDGTWSQVGEVSDAFQSVWFDIAGAGWLLSEAGVWRVWDGQAQAAGNLRVVGAAQDSAGQIFVVAERDSEMALWLIRPMGA
jgi:hypothetical protein